MRDRNGDPPERRHPLGANRRFLSTGTYLHTFCPHCRRDLIEGDWIHLKFEGPRGKRGELQLSPRFNVFDKRSTVELPEGLEVDDFYCPRCGKSLLMPKIRCEACGSRVADLHVATMHVEFDLLICLRIGCRWHGFLQD